jgi:O-antigen ligase/Flp pilus assembly protein TadD
MNAATLPTCRFYTLLALLFLTPLFYVEPAVFGINMVDAFTVPKRSIVQIAALILMLSYVVELAWLKKLSIRWSRSSSAFALFLLWALVSLGYGPSFHAGMRELIRWGCYGVIFFSAINDFRPEALKKFIVPAVLIPTSISSLFAIAQYFDWDPSLLRGGTVKIYTTIGNPNHLASYLAIALPLACFGWLFAPPRRGRSILLLSTFTIGTAALLLSGSRGGWVALLGGIAISTAVLRWPVPRLRALVLGLILVILITFLALPSPLNRYDTGALRKISEFTIPTGDDSPSPAQGGVAWRIMVWNVGWRMVKERPLGGWGFGSFNVLYLDRLADFFSSPGHKRYAPLAEQGIDYVHNDYLQTWIELGMVGLGLLAWFLASLIAGGFKSVKRMTGEERWISGALLAGCTASLVEGLVSFPFYLWSTAAAFFVFAGIIASVGSREKTISLERPPLARLVWLLPIAAVIFSLICIRNILGTFISEVRISNGVPLYYGGNRAMAFNEFKRAIQWQPHNGQARYFFALCLPDKGRDEDVRRELIMASRTFPRQALYVQLGRTLGRLGDRETATRILDKAILMLPRNPNAWLEKGNLLYESGAVEEAYACFQKSASIKPDYFVAVKNMAVSLHALGRSDEALKAYERALELNPREGDLYVNMGALLVQMGDKQRAREIWQRALLINPANEMARENLRRLEKRLKP